MQIGTKRKRHKDTKFDLYSRKAAFMFLCACVPMFLCASSLALDRDDHFDASKMGIGVRAMALGGVSSVLDSSSEGVFANPAMLALAPNFQLQSSSFTIAGDTSYKVLSLASPLNGFGWGLGIISNLSDGFTSTTYLDNRVRSASQFSAGDLILLSGLGKSFELFNITTRVGITFKYYLEIIDSSQRNALGGDLGFQVDLINNSMLKLISGATMRNFWKPQLPAGSGFSDSESVASQFAFGLGLGWKSTGLKTMADIIDGELHAGVEIPIENLDLRAGYGNGDMAFGLGLNMDNIPGFDGNMHTIALNYAYQQFPAPLNQEQTHALSISYIGLSRKIKIYSKPIVANTPAPAIQLEELNKVKTIVETKDKTVDLISVDLPKDKMRTDLDYMWVKGTADKDIRRVFINKKEVPISAQDRVFKLAFPLENYGKQLISIEAMDKNGEITKTYRRIYHIASFVDIHEKDAPAEAIYRMAEMGFLSGYKDNSFQPQKPLSRAEFASLVSKIKNLKKSHVTKVLYQDVSPAFWAAPHIEAVVQAGLMSPYLDGSFKPSNIVTHAEASEVLAKFSNAKRPRSVVLDKNAPLTRAEAALWLYQSDEVGKFLSELSDWDIGF